MILKSISFDNLPHPDYLSRIKFHVLEPFRVSAKLRALVLGLRKYRILSVPQRTVLFGLTV